MKKRTKKLSIILCLVLVTVMLFSGCAGGTDEKTATNNDTSKQEPTKEETNTDENSIYTEIGTYPIVNEKIELNYFAINDPVVIDFETNDFTKYLEELTNIKINWSFAPVENAQDKINLVLAGGDYPDVFFGVGSKNITSDTITQYGVEQGVFMPLNDLIESYMPNFKTNLLDEISTIKGNITSVDGNIYSLPTWNDCYHCNYFTKLWFNYEWLDKLGLEEPKTTEDFYNVLKAFKEQDPNGNGKQDEIPLTGSDTWGGPLEGFIMNAFITNPGQYSHDVRPIIRDGKIMATVVTDEYREGLKFMKRLYDDGLIAESGFTLQGEQLKQMAMQPDAELLGAFPAGHLQCAIDLKAGMERYSHYATLPPLEGPTGLRQAPQFTTNASTSKFVITNVCKYPQAAVRWADYMYTIEGALRIEGWEYETIEKPDGNLVGLDGKPAPIKLLSTYSVEPQNKSFMWVGIEYKPNDFRTSVLGAASPDVDLYSGEGFEKLLHLETLNKYAPYTSEDKVLPPLQFTADESDELQVIDVELDKYASESRLRFLVGDWDLDENWDEFVKGLNDIGLEKFIEIYQTAYDRQYK